MLMSRWFGCQFYIPLAVFKTMLQREPEHEMFSVELICSVKKGIIIFVIIHIRHKIKPVI